LVDLGLISKIKNFKPQMNADKRRMKPEIEVKIPVASAAAARKRIREAGFRVHVPRVFEGNVLWDTPDLRLRAQGKLVRLREAGSHFTLTFKGKSVDTRHKVREEVETRVENLRAMERVFQELELKPVFRYEKYRTEYTSGKSRGVVTLDETPIGTFLEIEGPARWIDRTAKQLGFSPTDYIILSYGALYVQYCNAYGIQPSNMVFPGKPHVRR
jgi:adenylate cyclase class 2